MKYLKSLAATILAGAIASQASAATTHIYVTGSTAFRGAAIAAIGAATHLGNTPGTNGIVSGGGTGNDTTYSAANPPVGQSATGTDNTSFIWQGGFITNADSSTTPVVVAATFTGSEAGIATCLGSLKIPFLPDGSVGTANQSAYIDVQGALPNIYTTHYTGTAGAGTGHYSSVNDVHVPDVAFSDVFQGTTPFNGSLALGTPFNRTVNFAAGNDNQVGYVTFKWVASTAFPLGTGGTGVNEGSVYGTGYKVSSINVEPNALNNLFTTGSIPLSQLTGNSADQHAIIFATGRNPDSGTRATALADTGIGVTSVLVQYQPTFNGSKVVTSQKLYPTETIAGLSTVLDGNSGEASGGTLRSYMGLTLPATGLLGEESGTITAAYYLTYLGTGDSFSVAGTAAELSYKGVPFSLNAIYQGQYTFWGIEHLLDRGDLAGAQATFRDTVVTTIQNTTTANLGKAGISFTDASFQATRFGDGTQVFVTFAP